VSRVLLISTYELGAQPLGLAWTSGELSEAGHEVRTCDVAVEPWPEKDIEWAEAVAFSVPMHTALRLALGALARVRRTRPRVPVAFYGLYAPVAAQTGELKDGDCAVAGESKGTLLRWLADHGASTRRFETTVDRGPARLVKDTMASPKRDGLPSLSSYARLVGGGAERLVATVEASRGCNHQCRHCPVPVVYGGRSRAVPADLVLSDIDALVGLGATHIHFSDPDFFNRPTHAIEIARSLHERHPEASFDATIKVSHLLRHKDAVAELARLGLAFVVSAFESTSGRVLERLDKGHSADDCATAVALLRSHGVEIRPSYLPFTPWTRRDDVVSILDFVARHDLIWNVDPVQYSIRLLIPPGSLVLEADDPDVKAAVTGFDPDQLGYAWAARDALLDELQFAISARVERAAESSESLDATYKAVRAIVFEALGRSDPGAPDPIAPLGPPQKERLRLSEPWFCCAEPTGIQLTSVIAR